MSRVLLALAILPCMALAQVDARIFEDAEDGSTARWALYDDNPPGASIDIVFDEVLQSNVVSFTGSATDNGFEIGGGRNGDDGWNETGRLALQWRMRTNAPYLLYIPVDTADGRRLMHYSDIGRDLGLFGAPGRERVHHGLGVASRDGEWLTVTRDLAADLADVEPGNTILAVHGLIVRGTDFRLDDLALLTTAPPNAAPVAAAGEDRGITIGDTVTLDGAGSRDPDGIISQYRWEDSSGTRLAETRAFDYTPSGIGVETITLVVTDHDGAEGSDTVTVIAEADDRPFVLFEDAEDGSTDRWTLYDDTPPGASVDIVPDEMLQSNVVSFTGSGTDNGFEIGGGRSGDDGWNDSGRNILQWRMRTGSSYLLYIPVDTTDGRRLMHYSDLGRDLGLYGTPGRERVHHGLGAASRADRWLSVTRDLAADLSDVEPGNEIVAVHGFIVRASDFRLDDLALLTIQPPNSAPTAEAGSDATVTAGEAITLDGSSSFDIDGVIAQYRWEDASGEVVSESAAFDYTASTGGSDTLTLVVVDEDGATGTDTLEVTVEADDRPFVLFEDGEDGSTDRWTLYDDTPPGASVDIVFDEVLDSNVVSFTGSGTGNGFEIGGGRNGGDGWNETERTVLQWRMRTNSPYLLYIPVDTADGRRLMHYSDIGRDLGLYGSSGRERIHHGLGTASREGEWVTVTRDLAADLADIEPGNTILSVHGLVVRGADFRLDDLALLSEAPPNASPVAAAGDDPAVTIGDSVTLDGSASADPDGIVSQYRWENTSGETLSEVSTLDYTGSTEGTESFTLVVTDQNGATGNDTVEITVGDGGTTNPTLPDLSAYELVFEDEFSGTSLDATKWDTGLLWGPYLPINREEQLYVDELGMHSQFAANTYSPFEFTGETLKIVATPTSDTLHPPPRPPEDSPVWQPRPYSEYRYNGPTEDGPGYRAEDVNYLSGILTSYGSFRMTHGYVEMRAKLPPGRGLWPAFWMQPMHYVNDVPEIDVIEFLGQDLDTLYTTYHYFEPQNNWRAVRTPPVPPFILREPGTDWTEDFHTFGMSWSPREIAWYVDGVETARITDADYDITEQSMYLIANLAVGGTWPGSPDASTPMPAEFEIDYIRAYKKALPDPLDLAADYQLMFADEFDGTSLDPSKWTSSLLWGPYLPINDEDQYYVDALGSDADLGYSPFTIADGVLSITARTADDPDGVAPPAALPPPDATIWDDYPTYRQFEGYAQQGYTSGILTSYDSFKFAHGYAEIRAKIPNADGTWPAFWLLNAYYVGQQPEIDVMEVRGSNPQQVVHSYHRYRNGLLESESKTTDNGDPAIGFADDFHTYGVRWQPDRIIWYIDGAEVFTYEGDDVAYQLMYAILNLAIDGNFNFVDADPADFPLSLDVDYVRIYQEKD